MPDPDPESKQPPDAGASGSVEVKLSDPDARAAAPDAVPEPAAARESQPITSGRVVAVDAAEPAERSTRTKRITSGIVDAVSGGVEAFGGGLGTLGEGVQKLGDITKKLPLVGAGVTAVGESLTRAGETIQILPSVTQTRRGRLLLRSVIVGFLLVGVWIAAIVGWQVRANDTPDFRPLAERILVEISRGSGSIDKVYEASSPRFQEMVRKERFVDDMTDMNATLGKFREITAINETLVTNGPTGNVGRVSLTAAFERGDCRGSISFHFDSGQWKLLGIGVEIPPELAITQAQREQRVAACVDDKGHDMSRDLDEKNRKKCPVRDAAETILEQARDGKAGDVWDAASPIFQKQESRARFVELQAEHANVLGKYKRIVEVAEAKVIGGTSATYDVVAEYEKSSGVRTVFTFERDSKSAPWRLRSLKVVVPMPRADEEVATPGSAVPPRAGSAASRGR